MLVFRAERVKALEVTVLLFFTNQEPKTVMIFSDDHYFTICFQMQPHSFTAGKPGIQNGFYNRPHEVCAKK